MTSGAECFLPNACVVRCDLCVIMPSGHVNIVCLLHHDLSWLVHEVRLAPQSVTSLSVGQKAGMGMV